MMRANFPDGQGSTIWTIARTRTYNEYKQIPMCNICTVTDRRHDETGSRRSSRKRSAGSEYYSARVLYVSWRGIADTRYHEPEKRCRLSDVYGEKQDCVVGGVVKPRYDNNMY